MFKYKVHWIYDYSYVNGTLTVKNFLSETQKTVMCLEGDVEETLQTIIKEMEGNKDETNVAT